MKIYLHTNWILRGRNLLNKSKPYQGWCLSLIHGLPVQASGDKKVGKDNNPHFKTKLSNGALIMNSINGRLWPRFLTSVLCSHIECQGNVSWKNWKRNARETKPEVHSSWCAAAFRWNPYHSLKDSQSLPAYHTFPHPPFHPPCFCPCPWNASHALFLVSPLGILFTQIFLCLTFHATSFPDFLI